MPLTLRQIEVLQYIACGCSYKEIARALRLSPNTIKAHIWRAVKRQGARERVQAAVMALREGMEIPEDMWQRYLPKEEDQNL